MALALRQGACLPAKSEHAAFWLMHASLCALQSVAVAMGVPACFVGSADALAPGTSRSLTAPHMAGQAPVA